LNKIDPLGEAGCDDLGSQGLSGDCVDSANFRENDATNQKGEVTTPNNRFNRDAVATSQTDRTATSVAASENQSSGNEKAFRVDAVETVDGTSATYATPIATTSATPTSARFPAAAIAGAEAMIHTHPTNAAMIVPGGGDWQAPALGVPNYAAHGQRAIVVEISGGQVRIRVVAGAVTPAERFQLKNVVNSYQRQGVRY
jgi:hypothetical protein